MKAWLQGNWKTLLALGAGVVLVIVLYLRTRSSSSSGAPASTISFPGNPDQSGGAGSPLPAAVSTVTQQFQGIIGPKPDNYNGPGVQYFSSAAPTSTIGYIPWNATFDITGPPVQGAPQLNQPGGAASTTWYPISFEGQTGWINQIAIDSFKGTPLAALTGQGGPGLDVAQAGQNLSRTALALQAASHRASLRSGRTSQRLALDARQAAAEGRRMFQESRGAAPIGGPLPTGGPVRGRWAWPR